MSLSDTLDKLKSVADEARDLFEALKDLAEKDKDATKTQKNKLNKLVDKLDENARKASRERREEEIHQLNVAIDKFDKVLSIMGLPEDIRDEAKAERGRKVARRGRLKGQAGTDFVGILTKKEVQELQTLVAKAQKEVQAKKKAAAFLQTAITVADLSLGIVAKLAV